MHRRSVRIRVTALATVVVALAIGIAGFALVHTVEDRLVKQVRETSQARIDEVARQLESGIAPSSVTASGVGGGLVEVVNGQGEVLGGSPSFGGSTPLRFITNGLDPGTSGGVQVSVPGPGVAGARALIPLDVRYQTVATSAGPVTVIAASPLDGVRDSINTLKQSLLLGLPFVVILVAIVAWLIVGRALRPVEAIRAEVEEISESSMHRRVPETGAGDEVDRLACTMNAMLDRLETSSVRQRQFVADASHELRSPIAAIRTQLEVALHTSATSPNRWNDVATSVLLEEQRLEGVVTDLLLLAAIDERPRDTDGAAVPVDVREAAWSQVIRARRVPVTMCDGESAFVAIRRDLLDRVLANLVDNAARHARTGVEIAVAGIDDRVRLTVDDDGPGIPQADRFRVFERFARLDDARHRDGGGAGLGLALVKAIVEREDGRVWVETAPMGGARLVVEFPQPALISTTHVAASPQLR
jgi:signal transduction histidine kinase